MNLECRHEGHTTANFAEVVQFCKLVAVIGATMNQ